MFCKGSLLNVKCFQLRFLYFFLKKNENANQASRPGSEKVSSLPPKCEVLYTRVICFSFCFITLYSHLAGGGIHIANPTSWEEISHSFSAHCISVFGCPQFSELPKYQVKVVVQQLCRGCKQGKPRIT